VAAKVLNQQFNEDQESELAKEVELMAQLDSPYLVRTMKLEFEHSQ